MSDAQSGYINPMTTLDFAYVLKAGDAGTFTMTLINTLNSLPPYDRTSPQSMVNYSLYDPNGRQVVLGYSKKF